MNISTGFIVVASGCQYDESNFSLYLVFRSFLDGITLSLRFNKNTRFYIGTIYTSFTHNVQIIFYLLHKNNFSILFTVNAYYFLNYLH